MSDLSRLNKKAQLVVIEHSEHKTEAAIFEGSVLTEYFIETPQTRSEVGNICRGKIRRVVPAMQAVFVDIGLAESGLLSARDIATTDAKKKVDLNEIFHEGQTVWVQVHKDAHQNQLSINDKGVRLKTELSIETGHLVYLPDGSGVSISKQIIEPFKRELLAQQVEQMVRELSIEGGFIIRSIVGSIKGDEWLRDVETLSRQWSLIKEKKLLTTKVGMVHMASSLLGRLSSLLNTIGEPTYEVIGVDSAKSHLADKGVSFKPFNSEELESYLDELAFEQQVQQAMNRLVELPQGGSIVIDNTEALTAIDVNMGSSIEKGLSTLHVNLHAAKMIAVQLKLRNLSGMIVIDFIRMNRKKDRDTLLQSVKDLMTADNVQVKVLGYTRLGLLEMTRERKYFSLKEQLS